MIYLCVGLSTHAVKHKLPLRQIVPKIAWEKCFIFSVNLFFNFLNHDSNSLALLASLEATSKRDKFQKAACFISCFFSSVILILILYLNTALLNTCVYTCP